VAQEVEGGGKKPLVPIFRREVDTGSLAPLLLAMGEEKTVTQITPLLRTGRRSHFAFLFARGVCQQETSQRERAGRRRLSCSRSRRTWKKFASAGRKKSLHPFSPPPGGRVMCARPPFVKPTSSSSTPSSPAGRVGE